jgi:myo-inositol 2-dehydrogenase/D-chiro-inositol 1-dehydrogenase
VYNVGLVGTGFMALKHVETLANHPRLRLSALQHTARSFEVAEQWQRKYGFAFTTDDYEEFLSSPSVDIVWICSPNDQHFSQTERALKAGKHVFCEKPLALSSGQAEHLSRLAKDSGQVLAVGMNCRFRHQYVLAKELAESGSLGRLFLVRGTYLYNSERAVRKQQKSWWLEQANQPLLLTSGLIHTLDLLVWVAGEVREVSAFGGETILSGLAGADTLVISLQFERGIIGELVASMATVRPNDLSLELYGESGSVIGDTLIVREQDQFQQSRLEISQPVLDLGLQVENILGVLDGRGSLVNDSERAARNLRVCESIQEALLQRRSVAVNYDDLRMSPAISEQHASVKA